MTKPIQMITPSRLSWQEIERLAEDVAREYNFDRTDNDTAILAGRFRVSAQAVAARLSSLRLA